MRREDLRYDLPRRLIAQSPAEPRDSSRLLVLHRASGEIEHRTFREFGRYLDAGDVLVCNDSRVIPARFFCKRATGGAIEVLFLREEDQLWRALLRPSARLHVGEQLSVQPGGACVTEFPEIKLEIVERHERGEWALRPVPAIDPVTLLERVGQTPLPPYIHREQGPRPGDRERYQTVYARSPGAVAAPTAGLHFTHDLLSDLETKGIRRASVTLHVGLGTFAPLEVDDMADHKMHREWFEVSADSAEVLCGARPAGGRIVAVGTTSARVLESLRLLDGGTAQREGGWTNLFIYPPRQLVNVDALLTNFHLPESTLLALVMAFGGIDYVRGAYRAAIKNQYRFYSYGDAMLIV